MYAKKPIRISSILLALGLIGTLIVAKFKNPVKFFNHNHVESYLELDEICQRYFCTNTTLLKCNF